MSGAVQRSWPQAGAHAPAAPDANSCGAVVVRFPVRVDPYRVARNFPDLWSAFLRRNYRNHFDLIPVFGVSESCARKWWRGEGGANADKISVAVQRHPEDALQTFFGMQVGGAG